VRFNRLDLNQLVALDALLSTRGVGKAADRLFLSQPATSCSYCFPRNAATERLHEVHRALGLPSTGGTMQWRGGKSGDSQLTELSTGQSNPYLDSEKSCGYACGA
jgi:hypothetical protein